jgi:hypothetical protein
MSTDNETNATTPSEEVTPVEAPPDAPEVPSSGYAYVYSDRLPTRPYAETVGNGTTIVHN